MDAVFLPYTFLEVLYLENLMPLIEDSKLLKHEIVIASELTLFLINGQNIFHYFANSNFLLQSLQLCINRLEFIEEGAKD